MDHPSSNAIIGRIDSLIGRDPAAVNPAFSPYWGWHDDHRATDGTPAYLPALQQVRAETRDLLTVLASQFFSSSPFSDPFPLHGSALQLGLGPAGAASHEVLRLVFRHVVSIDLGRVLIDGGPPLPGLNTADPAAVHLASSHAPYDFLMIDADHSAAGTERDHHFYGPMVRSGGIIAFHDALRRPGFEEAVTVWRYLETIHQPVYLIGREVGVAWLIKE